MRDLFILYCTVCAQDEDDELVFITSSNHRQHEKRGVGSFQSRNREDGDGDGEGDEDDGEGEGGDKAVHGSDELRDLRFTYHRTAFDIDIDELDEHTWRLPHTDVSDYFNYGFNEPTWRVSLCSTFCFLVACFISCFMTELIAGFCVCSPIVLSN